jgi:adenylate kinase
MRLVFLGPPGVGKGTQAELLSRELGIPDYSTGDIFRDILKESSELSKELAKFVNSGGLVPDEIVFKTVKEVLSNGRNTNGWLLDGYPRNRNQAEVLDAFLKSKNEQLDYAVYLYASLQTLVSRLSGRRVCSKCSAIFNLTNNPPKREGFCDKCGGGLVQREDDKDETIKKRISIFEKEFEPLEKYYADAGILLRISAEGTSSKEVAKRIKEGLKIG